MDPSQREEPPTGGPQSPPSRSWDVLTQEEWHNLDRNDAYILVQRLRPSWLNGRRAGSYGVDIQNVGETQVQVYVDGIRCYLGTRHLKTIPAQDVLEIRHLSPIDASIRFGTDHGAGAILLTTRVGVKAPRTSDLL